MGQNATMPFLTAGKAEASMPAMREALHGSFVWTGEELARSLAWRFELTPEMNAEIDGAFRRIKEHGGDWQAMRREDFPLPETRGLLDDIAETLERGLGLAKLSGLPVARYSDDDLKLIW